MNYSINTEQLNPLVNDKEKIVLVCRRYWATLMPLFFLVLLLCVAPWLIVIIFYSVFETTILSYDANIILGSIFLLVYYLCLALFTFINWIDAYFDVTYITNLRVIDVDHLGVVKRSTTAINLVDLRIVKASFSRLIEGVFNYGNVLLQTASAKESIVIDMVRDPKNVAKTINDLHAYLEYEQHEGHHSTTNAVQPPVSPSIYPSHPQRT